MTETTLSSVSSVSSIRDAMSRRTPGPAASPRDHRVSGVLVFMLADMIVFTMIFAGFMIERMGQLELFNRSAATLDVRLGVLNTLILIASGFLVVLAVHAAHAGRRAATRRWLLLSFVVGAGFGITKMTEYNEKIFGHGITMHTNDFYMFYFTLTGAHFFHFVAGMIILAALWFKAGRDPADARLYKTVEAGALYWHMVDLLWIFIFPMLYLLGASQ
ncbi:cytochrome c oxidase subunit 3 [Castellaniella defragrans]|uniref:Nitric oxide reductase NorE protein n=1 Tax=Castellaniella defragrans TaxID=75697 RepID=A0A7W9WPV0_CASDE|nr:cytochrome c oxidase subunit 3 [Castellaniella defragrans]KAB0622747.1 cytochrome c oxidase subunit 3 family protein [Castellaniella defragrans]MBB6085236.1 nitric oxide reductase NorE protein [Castellaniella defragrans]